MDAASCMFKGDVGAGLWSRVMWCLFAGSAILPCWDRLGFQPRSGTTQGKHSMLQSQSKFAIGAADKRKTPLVSEETWEKEMFPGGKIN